MKEKILILCKTYPNPSKKYRETVCVAGVTSKGRLIRLYPIPFRYLTAEKAFKKWQWIEADISKAKSDYRPESHKINDISTIKVTGQIDPHRDWRDRMEQLKGLTVYQSLDQIKAESEQSHLSLALLKPVQIIDLEISKESHPNWTQEELDAMSGYSEQMTLGLEDEVAALSARILEKIPYKFHYVYKVMKDGVLSDERMIIKDWEIAQLYRNCVKSHPNDWQNKVKQKYLQEFSEKDVTFLIGNTSSVPRNWMIISVIYPPKQTQQDLF